MPTIKIELREGRDKKTLVAVRDSVASAVIEVLRLPDDDKNVRLIEYPSDFFQMCPPYEMLIEITMIAGRTKDTKKKLYQRITEKLESDCSIEKEKTMIIINEQPKENWGLRGGIPADEINLGFNVNV